MEPCAEPVMRTSTNRRTSRPASCLARADVLAAVGEFDQELAAEIRDDPPLQDDLLFPLPPGRHPAGYRSTARRASPQQMKSFSESPLIAWVT